MPWPKGVTVLHLTHRLLAGKSGRYLSYLGLFCMEKRRKAHELGQGLVRSRPDTAGRSLWEAFAEPRVLGTATLGLTDGAPTALCQEGGSGSLPFLDCEKS